jgi:hypothetical protein
MGKKALVVTVVIQFVVICALGFLLVRGTRPSAERERVETALADIRGALSVGANYTQFQEKVQAFAAAIESFRSKGGAASDLGRFESAQKLYKDSLELWNHELMYPRLYELSPEDRNFVIVPTPLERIAKEQGFDLPVNEFSYKVLADELLRQLWTRADQAAGGVNNQRESTSEPTQPKK